MSKKKDCIYVVCYANYCRSPVAEKILNFLYKDKYEIKSAGIEPFFANQMDKRSINYLNKNNYFHDIHVPKKLTLNNIIESKYIFAMDINILNILNQKYKKYRNKIKMLNHQNPKILLSDPYKYDEIGYEKIMKNIDRVCTDLKI